MSISLIGSLDSFYGANTTTASNSTNSSAGSTSLTMTDFLTLMVEQFQYQDLDSSASTTDMMNQLVQMSVVQAVTDVTEAATMLYASSLVGKEVTIGQYVDGVLQELPGTVTATGSYNGEHVIFIGDDMYYLSDIMAIGTLPDGESDETTEAAAASTTESASGLDASTTESAESSTTESAEGTTESAVTTATGSTESASDSEGTQTDTGTGTAVSIAEAGSESGGTVTIADADADMSDVISIADTGTDTESTITISSEDADTSNTITISGAEETDGTIYIN